MTEPKAQGQAGPRLLQGKELGGTITRSAGSLNRHVMQNLLGCQ